MFSKERYRLFKVRDDLEALVVAGKLQRNDPLFEEFYTAVNFFLQRTNRINARRLTAALREARRRGIDPAEETFRQKMGQALEGQDSGIDAVIQEFYQAMLTILFENSVALRLTGRSRWGERGLTISARLAKVLRVAPFQRSLYKFCLDYAQAAARAASITDAGREPRQ